MIKIRVGNNARTEEHIIDPALTPKDVLEQAGISFATSGVSLNGAILNATEMGTPLRDLRADNGSFLVAITKTNNN